MRWIERLREPAVLSCRRAGDLKEAVLSGLDPALNESRPELAGAEWRELT